MNDTPSKQDHVVLKEVRNEGMITYRQAIPETFSQHEANTAARLLSEQDNEPYCVMHVGDAFELLREQYHRRNPRKEVSEEPTTPHTGHAAISQYIENSTIEANTKRELNKLIATYPLIGKRAAEIRELQSLAEDINDSLFRTKPLPSTVTARLCELTDLL